MDFPSPRPRLSSLPPENILPNGQDLSSKAVLMIINTAQQKFLQVENKVIQR